MLVKSGQRLRSATCTTEIIIVRAAAAKLDLRCGGRPMLPIEAAASQEREAAEPGFDGGTLLGKRYSGSGVEILCTKAGQGTLSIGGDPLPVMAPKQLPASD